LTGAENLASAGIINSHIAQDLILNLITVISLTFALTNTILYLRVRVLTTQLVYYINYLIIIIFKMFELGNTLDTVCALNFEEFYYINQQMHIGFNVGTWVSKHVGVLQK
jgi:hypothetical protein